MFDRLRREHGVRSYLAHNMTVTADNVDQIADVIRALVPLGFRMFSFQPAAYVGNEHRWREGFRAMTDDDVWARIEDGAGTRLPYRALQFGDIRCNRTTWGVFVGDRYVPAARRPRAAATWRCVMRSSRAAGQLVVRATFAADRARPSGRSAASPRVVPLQPWMVRRSCRVPAGCARSATACNRSPS